jgi:hypothetical protein
MPTIKRKVHFDNAIVDINGTNSIYKHIFVKFDDLGQITMPLNGFLYMLSVIEGLMKDDKMKDMIQRFQTAGIIPTTYFCCSCFILSLS